MQLRNGMPGILYPGHWGCFGGAGEPREMPADAIKRELREEIEFDMREAVRSGITKSIGTISGCRTRRFVDST
jgi:ADP-ribose pyrophosphatase YjhB (NUDIX family)